MSHGLECCREVQPKKEASDKLSRSTFFKHPFTGEVYLGNHLYCIGLSLPHTSLGSLQESLSYLIERPRIDGLKPLSISGISYEMRGKGFVVPIQDTIRSSIPPKDIIHIVRHIIGSTISMALKPLDPQGIKKA